MKRLLVAAVAAASCLGVAYAQENQSYQCMREGDSRSVAVEYQTDGSGAKSCSVMYQKQSQPAKELWHYQAHADQCQVQAEQFLKKLEGFGLACSAPAKTAMKQ
jgi:hypothetical protein